MPKLVDRGLWKSEGAWKNRLEGTENPNDLFQNMEQGKRGRIELSSLACLLHLTPVICMEGFSSFTAQNSWCSNSTILWVKLMFSKCLSSEPGFVTSLESKPWVVSDLLNSKQPPYERAFGTARAHKLEVACLFTLGTMAGVSDSFSQGATSASTLPSKGRNSFMTV